jgi:outer membrane PBP1 activator LpoA protein
MFRRHFLFLIAAALLAEPACAADTTLAENPASTKPADNPPHIALLLPLNADAFRQPADVVRQGFLAAAKAESDAPAVRVYPTTDEVANILTVYGQALALGARVVVGPLTKNAVSALALSEQVSVPTLSLSTPDQENLSIPPLLYLFGLSIEEEARQVAEMVARDGYRKPLIASAESPLAKRMQTAFAEQWRSRGRALARQVRFTMTGDLSTLRIAVQKHDADVIFLAANAQEARIVRPYLASTLPTYGTSQVFAGRTQDPRNVDLAGMRFIDMPWLLQPDHPAVMIYPHAEIALSAELERLYALGIDALRLASQLYRNPAAASSSTLDGVTGKLTMSPGHQYQRELVAAEFQQDSVVVIDPEP